MNHEQCSIITIYSDLNKKIETKFPKVVGSRHPQEEEAILLRKVVSLKLDREAVTMDGCVIS